MSLQQLYMTLLVGGLVVLVSIVATRVASRLGLPSLLLFLALGVVLGEDVLGIEFNDAQLAQNLGTAALAVILIDGGLTTDWSDIRSVIAPAGVLASAGVGMSTAVTAVGAHYLLAMGWQQAVLLGAILASTDAAAVFSVLRVLPLPRRVAGLLEAESGFNDAPSVVLVLLFSTTPFHLSAPAFVGTLLYELAAGVAIGVALGWLGAIALRRIALPASGLYPLATFGLGIVAFAAGGAAHASGFLAAYLAALILANTGLPHRAATRSFAEGLGWLAQMLGDVRDGDVLLAGLKERAAELPDRGASAAPVLETLKNSRDGAHTALLDALRSDRYALLLDRLVDAANAPVLTTAADEPAVEAIPALVRRPWHRLSKRAKDLGDAPTDHQLHDLRIRTKRARYAAEAAAPVVGKQARAFAHAAARLQDVLGDLNDAVIAAAWLSGWAVRDDDAARAAEQLAAAERAAADALRGTWRAAWDELADPRLRAWM